MLVAGTQSAASNGVRMQRLVAVAVSLSVLVSVSPAVGADGSCRQAAMASMLREFAPAYNEGEFDALNRLFARGRRFRSYDVHPLERTGDEAADRKTLIPYFRDRYEMSDRIQIESGTLRVARYNNGNRGFGFSLELDRTSDELSPFAQGHFIVKGSIDCDGIYFWNMTWNGP